MEENIKPYIAIINFLIINNLEKIKQENVKWHNSEKFLLLYQTFHKLQIVTTVTIRITLNANGPDLIDI